MRSVNLIFLPLPRKFRNNSHNCCPFVINWTAFADYLELSDKFQLDARLVACPMNPLSIIELGHRSSLSHLHSAQPQSSPYIAHRLSQLNATQL